MTFLPYFLGFLAACSNSASNVLQRAANTKAGNKDAEFSLQLIRNLIRQPIWFAGIAAMTASFSLQATGLGLGTLSGVEPVLVFELPLTLLASRFWLKENLDRRAWTGIVLMTASTVALIAFLAPSGGSNSQIPWWNWVTSAGATAIVIATCYFIGVIWKDPSKRSAILGLGTGLCYGLSATFMKGFTVRFTHGGILAVLSSWQLYSAVAVGIFAIWMHQNAVSSTKLVVAQPGITLGDPYISIILGVSIFDEQVRSGAWMVGMIISAVMLTLSTVILSGSTATSQDIGTQSASTNI